MGTRLKWEINCLPISEFDGKASHQGMEHTSVWNINMDGEKESEARPHQTEPSEEREKEKRPS